jgi:hypothetical protein
MKFQHKELWKVQKHKTNFMQEALGVIRKLHKDQNTHL